MEQPVLKAENILKHQPHGFTLQIPSLEFHAGRIYSIVGHNGAGKSTLLGITSLLDEPDGGDIYFMGERVSGDNSLSIRRKMGLVMENPYIFHASVYKNLIAGLKFRNVRKDGWRQMADEALALAGLDGFQERWAPELSRGESQRLAIARALVLQPDILFLDEPFTNIDKANVRLLEELVKSLKTRSTVVFTTHDLSQAYRLGDEIISLVEGHVVAGSMENLFYGDVEDIDGIRHVRVSPGIRIGAVTQKTGKVRLSIHPEHILVSIKPFDSSAHNAFDGVIRKIHMEGEITKLCVEVDRAVEFTVIITHDSYRKMNLVVGMQVYLTFKSTSVTVF